MRMPMSAPEAVVRDDIGTMLITFKLYAGLTDYLPPERRSGNQMPLEVAPGSTILQIIQPFHLPERLVKLVLVNGVYVPPEERATRTLVEGDVLAIWPPVAGG
jgi:sulfur carrier protein ThiS